MGGQFEECKRDVATDRLSVVIATAVDGVIIANDAGLIDVFNPACERLFGYRSDEVVGENLNILMPTPDREKHDRYIGNYLNSGEKKIIGIGREVTGRRKDGSVFPMDLSVGEAIHDGKRIFVGIIRDITARRTAENAIKRSVDELAAFAYSVAHDLKAPLRAIEGFSTALNEDYRERLDDVAIEYLNHITEGATRMGKMIDDLLEYSRIGREDLRVSKVSIFEIINSILKSLAPTIAEVRAVVEVTGDWQDVQGHRATLASVFQNLITNGVKFARPGVNAHVKITGRILNDGIEVVIADNGIGIPKNCHAKIFEIFHRLHNRAEYPGTGIGLAIVKKGIEMHQGSISIDSREGEGAAFVVTLPKVQVENTAIADLAAGGTRLDNGMR